MSVSGVRTSSTFSRDAKQLPNTLSRIPTIPQGLQGGWTLLALLVPHFMKWNEENHPQSYGSEGGSCCEK
ncbi:hypothetical protein Bhyg_01289 [Pseudolycoriella hygida]|uniref:Uncharacterized protein n=1 Tax=Pseudolycoriella hygida TaxID=35572 RepID=A0A9Q0N9D3_9DIPT|nr:hypothetical protein Bhyg_01289 [Pseudolycoriella hygida]